MGECDPEDALPALDAAPRPSLPPIRSQRRRRDVDSPLFGGKSVAAGWHLLPCPAFQHPVNAAWEKESTSTRKRKEGRPVTGNAE